MCVYTFAEFMDSLFDHSPFRIVLTTCLSEAHLDMCVIIALCCVVWGMVKSQYIYIHIYIYTYIVYIHTCMYI